MSSHNHRVGALIATGVAALALAASTSASASASAAKSKPFTGKFSGTASVVVSSSSDTVKSVNATGGAAGLTKLSGHNGAGAVSGSCAFFSGNATLTGSSGKVALVVKSTSKACGSETTAHVTGSATATGTSGKVKGTAGTVTFSGTYTHGNGAFSITMKGTV